MNKITSTFTFIPFILLMMFSGAKAQNLVSNPGFEELKDTISHFTANHIEFMEKMKTWTSPNAASPDVITPDFNERYIRPSNARNGEVMVGIQASFHWAEYISIELNEELRPNRTYYIEFWIRRAFCLSPSRNINEKFNGHFGVLFSSKDLIGKEAEMYIAKPQISVGSDIIVTDSSWVRVANYFTPHRTYSKLYLGQFRKSDSDYERIKNYYLIDDVKVIEVRSQGDLQSDIALPPGSIVPLKDVLFITGGVKLKDEKSSVVLNELIDFLKSNPAIRVRINGHTDAVGSDRSNKKLSKKRAKFIRKYIIESGVDKNRIEYQGFGEEHPVGDNETEAGRSKNRRVEFEIIN